MTIEAALHKARELASDYWSDGANLAHGIASVPGDLVEAERALAARRAVTDAVAGGLAPDALAAHARGAGRLMRGAPVAGVALAALATVDDVVRKHVDPKTALLANGAGLVAGEAAAMAAGAVALTVGAPAVVIVGGTLLAGTAASAAVGHLIEARNSHQ